MEIKLAEKIKGIRGTVTVRRYVAGTLGLAKPYADLARNYARLIAAEESPVMKEFLTNRRREMIEKMQNILSLGDLGRPIVQQNIVVFSLNYGLDILVQFLLSAYNGSFAFPLGIAWGEIGIGNTAPLNTDTALTTPTNRTSPSYAADIGYNEAQIQFFFPDVTLPNQTYYEFGTFIGGSATLGSGNMFNHALFASPYVKTSGTDTTVEVDFSFS